MAYEKEREQAKGLIDGFRALPYPGPMIAQMLEAGHFLIHQAHFEEAVLDFRTNSSRRVITVEFEQYLFPKEQREQPRPQPEYDFESTAEEIVDPTELPAPPKQLPRGG